MISSYFLLHGLLFYFSNLSTCLYNCPTCSANSCSKSAKHLSASWQRYREILGGGKFGFVFRWNKIINVEGKIRNMK